MDPVTIITTIGILAKEIYAVAQQVEINKAQCQRLSQRIQSISGTLTSLQKISDDDQFKVYL